MAEGHQFPSSYDELLRGAGMPAQNPPAGIADFSGLHHSTFELPATYDDLLRGAAFPAGASGGQHVMQRMAQLEQELMQPASNGAAAGGLRELQMSPTNGGAATMTREHQDLLAAYNQLLKSHTELVKAHTAVVTSQPAAVNGSAHEHPPKGLGPPKAIEVSGRIGIVRLDGPLYSAPDDNSAMTSPASGGRPGNMVFYQRVEGYTFELCKAGFVDAAAESPVFPKEAVVKIRGKARDSNHMFFASRRTGPWNAPRPRRPSRTEPWLDAGGAEVGVQYIYDSATVVKNLQESLELLDQECNVDCISGACGFMASVQRFCAANTKVPCLMSSLHLLPLVDMMAAKDSLIVVLTASSVAFAEKYDTLIKSHWDIAKGSRVLLVGLQDTDAFGALDAAGHIVDCEQATESIVAAVRKAMDDAKPKAVTAIVSECTELPGYTNALRQRFDCPVYDAITACNIFINARTSNEGLHLDPSYG